jgi:hypothetical protein
MAKYAADTFKKLLVQFDLNSSGYRNRLYNLGAHAFHIGVGFLKLPEEYQQFKCDGFWDGFHKKPNENNVMRSVLYFITGTTSEEDHTLAIKLAKVLEQFLREGVDHKDVAGLIKERGGVAKIYRSLCPAAAKGEVERDDLDLLKAAPPKRPADTPDAITDEPLDAPEGAPQWPLSGSHANGAPSALVVADDESAAERGSYGPVVTHRVACNRNDVAADEVNCAETQKLGPKKRFDLKIDLGVRMPWDLANVLEGKWALLLVEVGPASDRGFKPVASYEVRTFHGAERPWLVHDPIFYPHDTDGNTDAAEPIESDDHTAGGAGVDEHS